jgi:hypothetical protein
MLYDMPYCCSIVYPIIAYSLIYAVYSPTNYAIMALLDPYVWCYYKSIVYRSIALSSVYILFYLALVVRLYRLKCAGNRFSASLDSSEIYCSCLNGKKALHFDTRDTSNDFFLRFRA